MKSTKRVHKTANTKTNSKQPPVAGGWKHIEGNVQLGGDCMEQIKIISKTKGWGWSAFLAFGLRLALIEYRKTAKEKRAKEKDALLGLVFNGHPDVHLTRQLISHRLN